MKILSYGSDPEFLLYNKEQEKYISSLGLIPGDKNAPMDLIEVGEGYSIQKDNVLMEFCVPPAKTMGDIWNNIAKVKRYTEQYILPESVKIVPVAGAFFTKEDLDNPFAKSFGCTPSINAWSESMSEPIDTESLYRGAGMHIHFGMDDQEESTIIKFIKCLDLTIGLVSVLYDTDFERRKYYGRAGEFRPTNYGCEYRVLSAYTLSDELFFMSLQKGIDKAVDLVNNKDFNFSDEDALNIQTAINTGDKGLAIKLINKFNLITIAETVFQFN